MNPSTATLLVKIGGYASIGWLIFHLLFWRLFDWRAELKRLSYLNSGVMQVLNLCLSFIFLLFAFVSLWHTQELLTAGIGRTVAVGIGLFWFFRFILQPMFWGTSLSSVFFAFLFVLMSACYLAPWTLL
ncbi:MAG: hypothetical protein JNM09_10035 [Blastocatellia bacterium]|nr:hypothetical protein [Blastocatellia bacterium]